MTHGKIKILYIVTKSVWGGAQRYVYDLATNLSPRSFEIAVAFGGSGPLQERLELAGVRGIQLPHLQRNMNIFREPLAFFGLLSLIWHEVPDIVHLNSSKAGGLGALAVFICNVVRRTPKTRVVFTVHGWAFKEVRPSWQRTLIMTTSWLTALLAHHVIAVSRDDRERARWMPFVQNKISLIHNGIEALPLRERADARRIIAERCKNKLSSDEKTLWIGTVAELHRNKGIVYGIHALAEIVQKHPSVVWVIIGDGDERRHLEEMIVMKNLRGCVFLAGRIDNAAENLSAFDMFLLPSLKEGLPYTILEAASAPLAIIATSVGGIPEIIEDMHSGILIRPKNMREIVGALTLLIEEPEKRERLATALAARAKKEFSLMTMVRRTTELYRALCSSAPTP